MRRSLAMAVACCALAAGIAQAREFPYAAIVVADEAYARSGPGTGYYETLRLHKGDKVLVQRHDPGGWFAIAPPEGSFSWVNGAEVQKDANGIGTVIGNNIEVRVGSLKPVDKSFHQVRLSKGTQVKILDERRNANGGTVDWYRIAPPTGELRWIAGRDVSSEGEPKQSPGPASVPEADPQAQPDVPEPFDRGAVEAQRATASSTQPDREPGPTRPENAESGPSTRYTAKPYAPISESEDSTFRRDPSRGQSGRARRAPATGPAEPVVQFDPSPMLIAEANRDLVVMIRQDISLWDFTAIRRRFEEARDRATTPSGRAQALDRLDHLARYERIKANHDGFQSAMARSRYRDRAVESARQRQVEQQGPPRPRHDGSGVLRRAPFQGAGAPRYVLTDAQGNVRYYVVPGAGVDLHSYLGETVAVYGTQSYHADLLAHQITVRQVLPIAPMERAELAPPTRFE